MLVNERCFDGLQQFRLIALDRQKVITTLFVNLTGNVLLTSHGVDGDQKTMDIQGFEKRRDGRNLVALTGDFLLAKNDSQFLGECADHVNGSVSPPLPDPRTVLPSTARPPFRAPTTPATQRRNAAAK